jgi:hypothetical protein
VPSLLLQSHIDERGRGAANIQVGGLFLRPRPGWGYSAGSRNEGEFKRGIDSEFFDKNL